MKTLLITFFILSGSSALCQSSEFKTVTEYVGRLSKDSNVTSTCDTVIQLTNGNYFALVKNEIQIASTAESGYFDCYEISVGESGIQTVNSVLKIGSNTGGGGLCNIEYKLYNLDEGNYILVALKSVSHMGQYCVAYCILNCSSTLFEADALNDHSGHLLAPHFDNVISVYKKGKYLSWLTLKKVKTEGFDILKITTESYKIGNFDTNFNCFKTIALNNKNIKMKRLN